MENQKNILLTINKWSFKVKLLISVVLIVLYIAQLYFLFPVTEYFATMQLAIPVTVIAALLGVKYGVRATLFCGIYTMIFIYLSGLPIEMILIKFIPGYLLTFILVLFIGRINELTQQYLNEMRRRNIAQKEIAQKNIELQVYTERLQVEIEEKFRTEQILKKSEEQYRNLIEKGGIGVFIDDLDGNLKYFNEQFVKITGFPADELSTKKTIDLVCPDYVSFVRQKYQETITGESKYARYEFGLKRFTGEKIYVEVDLNLLVENELVQGTSSYIWDISVRKKAEMALIESEERFRGIYNNATMGLYRMTPNGNIIMANPVFLKMLKFNSLDDIKNKRISDILETDEKRYTFFDLLINDKKVNGFESEWYRSDGTLFFGRETAWTIYDAAGEMQFVDVILEDITQRKQIEAEREQLIFLLQSAKSEIKILSGLLPICASCKMIRDENGNWSNVEQYIDEHSEAEFSHGICPNCASKLYPGYS